jgi:catechol 2,3-dioxygenase-like lactoylglutathione lyase family enzyme
MAIVLDHTIVPARDKVASARFFARIFGLEYKGPHSHFAPVQVNEQLTLDFDERGDFEHHHYAFRISEAEFDAIFARVKEEGIAYGSGQARAPTCRSTSGGAAAASISRTRTATSSKC